MTRRPRCGCLYFETDSPELYRGRRYTTCPLCGRRPVEILRVDGQRIDLAEHRQGYGAVLREAARG